MPIIREIKRRSGGKTDLVLSGGRRFTWPSPVVTGSSLEEGDNVSPEELEAQLQEQAEEIFPVKARKYLARYMRTTQQYIDHFTAKGYPDPLVEGLVPALREEGYLNDRRVAEEHLRKRLQSKPRGRRKLIAELKGKGIESDLARRLVEEKVDPEKERELAEKYGKKNRGLSASKLGYRLKSRGFPAHIIHDVVEKYGN